MNHESPQGLRCTFADAEYNNLLAAIRMSTKVKVELFEEMLDFAWRSGAMQKGNNIVNAIAQASVTAGTPSKR